MQKIPWAKVHRVTLTYSQISMSRIIDRVLYFFYSAAVLLCQSYYRSPLLCLLLSGLAHQCQWVFFSQGWDCGDTLLPVHGAKLAVVLGL